jgi:predicted metal-dependent hydrolase
MIIVHELAHIKEKKGQRQGFLQTVQPTWSNYHQESPRVYLTHMDPTVSWVAVTPS